MTKSFIEVQFPIEELSAECYKERKSVAGQTLTGLGKWWGRKPLILVRAVILGSLIPATNNPDKDMEIFKKILLMDGDGLWLRCNKKKMKREDFDTLTYEEKLAICVRPEHIVNLPESTFKEINDYLGTKATTIPKLFQQLGKKKFGENPKVLDCFAGGGSIPFEAARMGCETYASDLNPVACMLNWANLNILSKSDNEIEKLKKFQQEVYKNVVNQVNEWGIEKNENGETADVYLYLTETICPHCNTLVPLAPSFIVSKNDNIVAQLIYNEDNCNYDIYIKQNASNSEVKKASEGTIKSGRMICPHCNKQTMMETLRRDKTVDGKKIYGLPKLERNEFIARKSDTFQERLYCIRYVDKFGKRKYVGPNNKDLEREQEVIKLLSERFDDWQSNGFIPYDKIEDGEKTIEPIRNRGWQYWHQLFNPRQLLINGLFNKMSRELAKTKEEKVLSVLGINKISDWNSKLSIWDITGNSVKNTFMNQALNTMFNYATRGTLQIDNIWNMLIHNSDFISHNAVRLENALNISCKNHLTITDPPYADAVNYHELSEFFLAWDKKVIQKIFPEWYTDSKRSLAVRGKDRDFKETMVDIYSNLTNNLSDDGYQVVMFTHQDASVWADLGYIVWLSGLQICQAWCVSTETESGGLKNGGNYVKGTVILILKKKSKEKGYVYDLELEIEDTVKEDLNRMFASGYAKHFKDGDLYLSAYASALKVVTYYSDITGINAHKDLLEKKDGEITKLEELMNKAKAIATEYIVPSNISKETWKSSSMLERFLLSTYNTELENKLSLAQIMDLAKTFNVRYSDYLENSRANTARLMTSSEFKSKFINDSVFGATTLRQVLYAVYISETDSVEKALLFLKKNEKFNYVLTKQIVLDMLNFFEKMYSKGQLKHWKASSENAGILAEYIRNNDM